MFLSIERHGAQPAVLLSPDEQLTYAELAAAADRAVAPLGQARRLIAIEAVNELPSLLAYVGALRARLPVLLLPEGAGAQPSPLLARMAPAQLFHRQAGVWQWQALAEGDAQPCHDDLALLLPTSGSTGSAKLVRLSYANLAANAASIQAYLAIKPGDRAITSLAFSYAFGLSVINSHLAAGASLVLTRRSVAEPEFWTLLDACGANNFSGVPHSFELLERQGFTCADHPGLRYLAQAGGKLAPAKVVRFAQDAAAHGVQFFVMYGQTEAAPRMAYLPPELAIEQPDAIGRPVPGGAFALIDEQGRDVTLPDQPGELVYRGPNVMLGYAERPADLARGAEVEALHTGDLAVRDRQGLYHIVGRKSRFSKLFGLRISQDEVERWLTEQGWTVAVTGDDAGLVVATEGAVDGPRLARLTARRLGLPVTALRVEAWPALPRLANGKLDYAGILAQARRPAEPETATSQEGAPSLRAELASLLGRPALRDHDSFASVGGDSLTYVQASLAIEQHCGQCPRGWEAMSMQALEAYRAPGKAKATLAIETLLRAVGIATIVLGHLSERTLFAGGAVLLLLIAGYNFARFQLPNLLRGNFKDPLRALFFRIVLPYYAMLTFYFVLKRDFYPISYLMVSNITTKFEGGDGNILMIFWFIEVYVQILLGLILLFMLPSLRRLVQRQQTAAAVALLGIGVLFRVVGDYLPGHGLLANESPLMLLYLFALGACIYTAPGGLIERLALSVVALATLWRLQPLHSPFGYPVFLPGLLLLIWTTTVPVPGPLRQAIAMIAAASFMIYLSHPFPERLLQTLHGGPLPIPLALAALPVVLGIGIVIRQGLQRLEQRRGWLDRLRAWRTRPAGGL